MTRETQRLIKQNKEEADQLIRWANPRSKTHPRFNEVIQILQRHIPYYGIVKPVVVDLMVKSYNINKIQKSAHFIVRLEDHREFDISVYQNLVGRTPEEKESDKTADFPSGLFNIFHDEIKAVTA